MVAQALPRLSPPSLLLLAAILAVGAVLRLWGLDFGLPFGNARPDETYIMDVVRPLLQGTPPPPRYEYPWLYMGLTALGWCAYYPVAAGRGLVHAIADLPELWRSHSTPFFLIQRGITAAFGVATVAIVFALARRVGQVRTGLVAAALLAVAYLHVRNSHFGTTDVPMTAFATLSVLLLLRAHAHGSLAAFAWAGLAGGLAGATKYTAVFVVVAAVAAATSGTLPAGERRWRVAVARLGAFAGPCGAAALAGIPFAFTDTARFVRELQLLFTSTSAGQAHLGLEPGWITHVAYSLRYGVGLGGLVLGAAGALLLAWRQPAAGAVLLAFPISYYAVVGAAGNQYFRYAVPLVPFLCVTAAYAIDAAADALTRRWPTADRRAAAAVAAAFALLLAAEPAWRSIQFDRALAATDNRVVVADWLRAHLPPGSSLLVTGSHYGHPWLPADRGYRLWVWDRREQRFWSPADGDGVSRPEWILRQEHALTGGQRDVEAWLRDGYVVAGRFPASRLRSRPRVFDRMDAFYLPYAGFDGVIRPGPDYTLFRRADLQARSGVP